MDRQGGLILTIHGGKMKIEKRVLGGALRVLGKVACQNSPAEEYRSIRFCAGENSVNASAWRARRRSARIPGGLFCEWRDYEVEQE